MTRLNSMFLTCFACVSVVVATYAKFFYQYCQPLPYVYGNGRQAATCVLCFALPQLPEFARPSW